VLVIDASQRADEMAAEIASRLDVGPPADGGG
jgi:hypothetical protein